MAFQKTAYKVNEMAKITQKINQSNINYHSPCVQACIIGSIMNINRVGYRVIVVQTPKEECDLRAGVNVKAYGFVSSPAYMK